MQQKRREIKLLKMVHEKQDAVDKAEIDQAADNRDISKVQVKKKKSTINL